MNIIIKYLKTLLLIILISKSSLAQQIKKVSDEELNFLLNNLYAYNQEDWFGAYVKDQDGNDIKIGYAKTKIERIISQFEFDPLLTVKAKHLSRGQKKKLVIAMALVNDPKILLLDEPFAALDILTIKMLQEIIVNLQSIEKITLVICDHQARDLLSCVDRAIVLSNGKIIASGSPEEIVKDSTAKSAYFGDEFKIK